MTQTYFNEGFPTGSFANDQNRIPELKKTTNET
jgi:hypothetical protein